MHDIFAHGAAASQRKKIYDAIHKIEGEKNRKASEGLYDYKHQIDHVRLDIQAREAELHKRKREELTYPKCGVKQMRIQTRPIQPFGKV